MEPLATVEELAARLPFVMDDDEEREAAGALEDLSDDARDLGKAMWATPATTPRPVITLILRAASRHMKNHDGFVNSRAGDESVTWTDRGHAAGSAYFTTQEKDALRRMANRGGLTSAPVSNWGTKPQPAADESVPVSDLTKPFPFYAAQDGGW